MKRLFLVVLAAGALTTSCNPVARCKAASDCGGVGVCAGGFCSEFPLTVGNGDGGREATDDLDALGDSGVAEDAGFVEYDAGTNGRP